MRVLSIIIASFLFVGCSNKALFIENDLNNQEIKSALMMYKRAKNDKGIQKYAPEELYKATKIANALVNKKDTNIATYYAKLLKKQVRIAELTKREYELTNQVNQIIIKRNEAIEDAKHQDDGDNDEVDDTEVNNTQDTTLDASSSFNGIGLEELKASFSADNADSGDFVIGGKYFDNDDLVLNHKLKGLINYLAQFLKSNPDKKLLLQSYTDGIGSKAYSIDMALRRAKRFKDELIAKGVKEDRVKIDPKGAVDFIGSNDTEEGREKNNRIVIIIK